ncbi:uncharacterized protein [Dysidea avara]|uniref:uncharacterized protein isoform X2 n=1 Tax=Dysidea avara TaxID=196820 RepID=UPI00332292E9
MLELSLPRLPHPILYISKSDLPICVMATCGRRLHLVRSLPTSTKMHWSITSATGAVAPMLANINYNAAVLTVQHIHKCDTCSHVTSTLLGPISANINYNAACLPPQTTVEWSLQLLPHQSLQPLTTVNGYISYTPAPITPISSSINHNEMSAAFDYDGFQMYLKASRSKNKDTAKSTARDIHHFMGKPVVIHMVK